MPVRHCSRDCMAIQASSGLKYPAAFAHFIANNGWFFFVLHPSIELFARINVHTQQHFGVLRAAILRALTEIESRLVGVDPCVVFAVWNQVRFSRKTWHPKAVVGISRKQGNESG